jgi:hypothetical protein
MAKQLTIMRDDLTGIAIHTNGARFHTRACVTLTSRGDSSCSTSYYRNNSAGLA